MHVPLALVLALLETLWSSVVVIMRVPRHTNRGIHVLLPFSCNAMFYSLLHFTVDLMWKESRSLENLRDASNRLLRDLR